MGLELNEKAYQIIDNYCSGKGIHWFASAWDSESQKFLRQYGVKRVFYTNWDGEWESLKL